MAKHTKGVQRPVRRLNIADIGAMHEPPPASIKFRSTNYKKRREDAKTMNQGAIKKMEKRGITESQFNQFVSEPKNNNDIYKAKEYGNE
jgi:hypothetical protein